MPNIKSIKIKGKWKGVVSGRDPFKAEKTAVIAIVEFHPLDLEFKGRGRSSFP